MRVLDQRYACVSATIVPIKRHCHQWCCPESPITRSIASVSCCLGTSTSIGNPKPLCELPAQRSKRFLAPVLSHRHEFLDELAQGQCFEPVTSGAVTHARAKLKESAFSELNRDCVLPALYRSEHPVRRWRGHRLMGFDSSLVRLPESEELGQAFGWQEVSNQNGATGTRYPEARLSVVYDVLDRKSTRLNSSHLGISY